MQWPFFWTLLCSNSFFCYTSGSCYIVNYPEKQSLLWLLSCRHFFAVPYCISTFWVQIYSPVLHRYYPAELLASCFHLVGLVWTVPWCLLPFRILLDCAVLFFYPAELFSTLPCLYLIFWSMSGLYCTHRARCILSCRSRFPSCGFTVR